VGERRVSVSPPWEQPPSLLHGSLLTVSMLWEIAFWIAVFAVLSLLDDFVKRRRTVRRL
jgi:hypothetical protein